MLALPLRGIVTHNTMKLHPEAVKFLLNRKFFLLTMMGIMML